MDAGPSYSYQHDLKYATPYPREGKEVCLVQKYHLLLCTSTS